MQGPDSSIAIRGGPRWIHSWGRTFETGELHIEKGVRVTSRPEHKDGEQPRLVVQPRALRPDFSALWAHWRPVPPSEFIFVRGQPAPQSRSPHTSSWACNRSSSPGPVDQLGNFSPGPRYKYSFKYFYSPLVPLPDVT